MLDLARCIHLLRVCNHSSGATFGMNAMGTRLTSKPDVLVQVETRCTSSASELLRRFGEDPLFLDVIRRLERVPGTIYRGDVEMFISLATAKARMAGSFYPSDA